MNYGAGSLFFLYLTPSLPFIYFYHYEFEINTDLLSKASFFFPLPELERESQSSFPPFKTNFLYYIGLSAQAREPIQRFSSFPSMLTTITHLGMGVVSRSR